MSKKTQYSDYVVLRESGEVFELALPFAWEIADTALVVSRCGKTLTFSKNNLIRIPNEFTAYIKSDTSCHTLKDSMQVLRVDLEDSEESFHNPEDDSGIWFVASDRWVPLRDIDLSTIFSHDSSFDDYIIPPMPSLEELQKCSIHYEGRKTVLTYCDAFVGEAICHKDDEFKVESGIALAYSRAKEAKDEYDAKQEEAKRNIKVGDVVRIADKENIDCTLNPSTRLMKMLYKKTQNVDACLNFVHGSLPNRGKLFRVLYVDDFFAKAFIQEAGLCDNTHFVNLKDLEIVHSNEEGEYVLWF